MGGATVDGGGAAAGDGEEVAGGAGEDEGAGADVVGPVVEVGGRPYCPPGYG